MSPHWIEVVSDFNVRGNIKTVIRAEEGKKAIAHRCPCPPRPSWAGPKAPSPRRRRGRDGCQFNKLRNFVTRLASAGSARTSRGRVPLRSILTPGPPPVSAPTVVMNRSAPGAVQNAEHEAAAFRCSDEVGHAGAHQLAPEVGPAPGGFRRRRPRGSGWGVAAAPAPIPGSDGKALTGDRGPMRCRRRDGDRRGDSDRARAERRPQPRHARARVHDTFEVTATLRGPEKVPRPGAPRH